MHCIKLECIIIMWMGRGGNLDGVGVGRFLQWYKSKPGAWFPPANIAGNSNKKYGESCYQ